jgi:uncharacterized membrane protein YagU involved in acid resistance
MDPAAPTIAEPTPPFDARLAAIGFASGIVAALAMDTFARVMRRVEGGREAPGATPGADREGRGPQPAQAEATAGQDATVKVGTAAFRGVAGYTPSEATQQWLGTAAHYAFSGALGANYVLASEAAPDLRRGYGTMYGSLVWATADEGAIPAMGLSKTPDQIPLGVHAYALASHWVFGATLEACRRIAAATLTAWQASANVVEGSTADPSPAEA